MTIGGSLGRVFRLLFRTIESKDLRRRRLQSIIQGAITSLGGRVISLLVTFLSVPLTINYLGPERYGAWVTLGSLLAWVQMVDLGLGNGLTNAISTALGQDKPELVRVHISNAMFVFSLIAAATGLISALAWPLIDWTAIFGLTSETARSEISGAMAAALTIFLLQFPLSLAGRVYVAMQDGRIANYWGMAGSVLSLLSLLAVTYTHGGLLSLVIAVSGMWLLVNIISTLWLFTVHRRALAPSLSCLDTASMRALGSIGSKFFLIQIMGMVTFQTDTLVISHYLGAANVPQYSLTYSLFNYTTLPHSLLFSYLWAAYSEAIARNDIAWVKRTFHTSLLVGTAFTCVGAVVLLFIAQRFVTWWSGGHVIPSSHLVEWMAVWSVVNAFTIPMACLLASAAHLRTQTMYSAVATALNIVLSIILVQRWGVTGVIAGTVVSYVVFICGPLILDAELLLRRLARRPATAAT